MLHVAISGSTRALFVPAGLNPIRAAAVAMLGARRLSAGESDDVERFVPTYLRKSDAELQRADAVEILPQDG